MMATILPRWFPNTLPLGDAQFLADSLARAPGLEPVFQRAFNTPMIDRRRLIVGMMDQRHDPMATTLDVPPLWHITPGQRSDDRAIMAELFAPNSLRDAQQASNWARIDESFEVMRGVVVDHRDTKKAGFTPDEQQRLSQMLTTALLGRDTGDWQGIKTRIEAGNSQLARWVGDTGRLQTLSRALSLEADWPDKKAQIDLLWVCNGGGEIRSEAGRALRRKLVIERHDLHHGKREAIDYAPDRLSMRLLGQTEGKDTLHRLLSEHKHPNPRLNAALMPGKKT